jgi:hypothetical protein
MLNINQRVLSLAAGRLNEAINRDTLLIGTPTNLLVSTHTEDALFIGTL